ESYFLTYDLASGRELAKVRSKERYAVTELSRDGRQAVVLGKLFDIGQGKDGPTIIPEKKFFWISGHTALSADGRYYAIHALPQPQPAQSLEPLGLVLETASGKPIAVLKTGAMGKLAFTPDQRRLVTADWDGVRLWDLATEKCLLHHRAHNVWDSNGQSL